MHQAAIFVLPSCMINLFQRRLETVNFLSDLNRWNYFNLFFYHFIVQNVRMWKKLLYLSSEFRTHRTAMLVFVGTFRMSLAVPFRPKTTRYSLLRREIRVAAQNGGSTQNYDIHDNCQKLPLNFRFPKSACIATLLARTSERSLVIQCDPGATWKFSGIPLEIQRNFTGNQWNFTGNQLNFTEWSVPRHWNSQLHLGHCSLLSV